MKPFTFPKKKGKFVQITPFGDWAGTVKKYKNLSKDIKKSLLKSQYNLMRRYVRIVKNHIENQDLNWEPKGYGWRYSDKLYIETRTFFNSIQIWSQNGQYYAGIKRFLYYHREGQTIEISKVAWWLERGTRSFPARPLWGPSYQELGGDEGVRRYMQEQLGKHLTQKLHNIQKNLNLNEM